MRIKYGNRLLMQWVILTLVLLIGSSFAIRDKLQINIKNCKKCESTTHQILEIGEVGSSHTLDVNASSNSYFFIVQVHSYLDELQLSYDPIGNRTNSVRGTDIGLNQIIGDKTIHDFYLFHNFTVRRPVLVAISAYLKADPIPGGCNMEFNTRTAPYQKLSFTKDMITVDVQRASVYNRLCELQENITMESYQIFAPEATMNSTYSTIINMMTVDKIRANGHKVIEPVLGTNLRRLYSNYVGFSAVYAVIVSMGNRSAAYVPISTFGCDMHDGSESCYKLDHTEWIAMSALSIISLILLLTPFDVLVPLFNFGYYGSKAVVTFIGEPVVFSLFVLEIAGAVLVVASLLGYVIRKYDLHKVTLRIYAGHILTALIYFGTATGDYSIPQTPWFFWILYLCLICMTLVPGSDTITSHVNIFFQTIIIVDCLIGNSRMMYFNINAVRRAGVSKFYLASVYPPYNSPLVIGSLIVIAVLYGLGKCICNCCQNTRNIGETVPLLS